MSKGKVKEKASEIALHEVKALDQAIDMLLATSPTMKGKLVGLFHKNKKVLKPLLKSIDDREQDIVKKHVKMKKNGEFDLEPFTEDELKTQMIPQGVKGKYQYKEGEKGIEKANKEMKTMLEEKVEIKLVKIWSEEFNMLDINTARNQHIGLLIDCLVTEELQVV